MDLAPLVKSRASLFHRPHQNVPGAHAEVLAQAALPDHLHRRTRPPAGRRSRPEIRAGHYRGPLHGIPFGLKDLFDTKGILTTFGAEPYQTRVADKDATVVERLHNAGAVLIAKLSMGALAQGGPLVQGMTKTPWNTEQTSSGSSAGSASSTAGGTGGLHARHGDARLHHLAQPGLRHRRTAAHLRPHQPLRRHGAELDHGQNRPHLPRRGRLRASCSTRSTDRTDDDRTVGADPFHWEPRKPLAGLRIGILQKDFDRCTGRAEEDLRQGARRPHEGRREDDPDRVCWKTAPPSASCLSAEAAAAFDDITRDGQVRNLRGQTPGRLAEQLPHLAPDSGRRVHPRPARAHAAGRKFEKFMADWDVLVMPPQFAIDHHQSDRQSAGGA